MIYSGFFLRCILLWALSRTVGADDADQTIIANKMQELKGDDQYLTVTNEFKLIELRINDGEPIKDVYIMSIIHQTYASYEYELVSVDKGQPIVNGDRLNAYHTRVLRREPRTNQLTVAAGKNRYTMVFGSEADYKKFQSQIGEDITNV